MRNSQQLQKSHQIIDGFSSFIFKMTVGERFKKVIDSLNYNQREISEKLGIDKSTVSRIVSNQTDPSIEVMQKAHRLFGINLNWLIDGTGKMKEGLTGNSTVNETEVNYSKKSNPDLMQKIIDAQDKTIKTYEDRIHDLSEQINELKSKSKNQTYTK